MRDGTAMLLCGCCFHPHRGTGCFGPRALPFYLSLVSIVTWFVEKYKIYFELFHTKFGRPVAARVFFRTSQRRKAPVPSAEGKPPFERRCPSSQTGAEDCISPQAKCAKQTQFCKSLFTAYVLLRKTQSSVSLRLTAPFKRGLWSNNETVRAEKPPSPRRAKPSTLRGGGFFRFRTPHFLCPRPFQTPENVLCLS